MSRIVPRDKSAKKTDVDRIWEFYDKGKELPADLELRREQLEQAWDLCRLNPATAIKLIILKMKVSKPTAYKLKRDCQELFGLIEKTSKEAQRALLTQQLQRIAKKAEKAKEFDAATRALATIGKIQRLDQPDDEDVVTLTLPRLVMWTTDPQTLVPVKVEDRPYVEAE